MTKIKYKIPKLYIFPYIIFAALIALTAYRGVNIYNYYQSLSDSINSSTFKIANAVDEAQLAYLLTMCVFMVILLAISYISKRSITTRYDDIINGGMECTGKITAINANLQPEFRNKNFYSRFLKYSFTVEYIDPYTGEIKTRESMPFNTKYELDGGDCKIKVLGDNVFVYEADVKPIKMNISEQIIGSIIVLILFTLIAIYIINAFSTLLN